MLSIHINGNLTLDDIIPIEKREMYESEPKRATETTKIIIEEILLSNPQVISSRNKKYIAVIYNQSIYSGKYFSKSLFGTNSKVQIYNNLGDLVHEFEFGSALGSCVISDDGRYLTFTYHAADADRILVRPGMSIYDCYIEQIVLQKAFDKNSCNPSTTIIDNLYISTASISSRHIQYFVVDFNKRILFEIKVPYTLILLLDFEILV